MADTHETIADIIAKKRRRAEDIRNNLSTVPFRQWDQKAEIKSLEDEADRLEAAHERELSKIASKNGGDFGQLGDAAKMREALRAIKDINDGRPHDAQGYEINDIIEEALAAPPRNCDVGTAEEQAKRMDAYCASHGKRIDDSWRCDNCPLCSVDRCDLTWAQMPYVEKEGGAK